MSQSTTSTAFSFILNSAPTTVTVPRDMLLLDLLRDELGLTGTKRGCGVGECGACTVIIDGQTANACLVLAGQIENSTVITIEGISQEGEPSQLQRAFMEHNAIQCGFCTPGMLMSATALLLQNPHPTDEEIKTAISGNLCRCTGYQPIVNAIASVRDAT